MTAVKPRPAAPPVPRPAASPPPHSPQSASPVAHPPHSTSPPPHSVHLERPPSPASPPPHSPQSAPPVARPPHSALPSAQAARSQPVYLERPPHSTSPPPRPNRLEQPPRPVHLDPPPRPARPAQIFRRLCLTALLSLGGLLLPAQAQAQDAGICARTSQVQAAIFERLRGVQGLTIADCSAVTAAHLSSVTSLNVTSAGSLQSGDFAGMSSLTSLRVANSSLTSLPAGLLNGLSALTSFIVENTSVRTVPSGLFSATPNLTDLRLRRSQLAALPAGLFAGLDLSGDGSQLQLDNNPGSPFTLGLRVERQTSGSFRVRVVEGAPGPLTVDWARPGISGTLNIAAGRVTSLQFSNAGPLPTLSNPRFTSGAGNYDGIMPGILTVSGTALSETTLTLAEDGSATYTVALSGLPQTPVTITPASDNPDVMISPAALIFSAANWNVAQTVTLSAIEDDDLLDDTANITHALSGADYPGGASGDSLVATVTDTTPDTPPTFGALSQPDQAYTGRIQIPDLTLPLATAGNGDITYTLTPTIATAVPGLAFDAGTRVVSGTPSAVLTATTVTLTYTAHDADDNAAAADAATLTFAITVNPGVGVVFSPAALEIFEEGAGGAYTVALNTDPGAGFTVRIQPEGDARMTFVPSGALEFTTANWNTPQVVNVSAGADTNPDNETVPVTHTVTATGAANPYTAINGVSAGALPVTVFDDDHYVGFFSFDTFSTVDALEVNEGSAVTLNLETRRSVGNSRLESARIVPDDGGLTVTTSAPYAFNLRFFPAFTVTFTANEDGDAVDNTYRYVVRYTPQIGGDRATREFSFPITVTDTVAPTPAPTPAVTIAPLTLTIDEGAMDTYTVTLATNPGGAVTVTPASDNTADVPTPSALTFAAAEWNTPQTVTVTANEDADAADESANITHTVAGYTGVTAADNDPLRVTVDDDETAGVTLSENSLELGEDDSDNDLVSDTYEVTLDTPPSAGNVVVTPVSSDTGIAAVSPAALTFDDGNWNIAQVVTISAVTDPDGDDGVATINHTVTVTVGGAAEYDGIAAGNVEVDVYDTLVGGIVFAPASLTVTEGGSGIYTVALSIIPSGEVTIPLQVTTASLATFEPAAGLTFSPSTWNIPQTVTVGTTTDPDARRNPNALVRHQASGGGYDASPASSYAVVITETGSIGVSISTPTLTVDEGDFASYTVALTSPPSIGEVTVTPGSVDTSAVLVTTAALVFDAADWNMPQTVSVQGVADADSADESVVITHEVTVDDASSEYDGATAAGVTVTVTDAPAGPAGGPAFAAGVTVDDQVYAVNNTLISLSLPTVAAATPGEGTVTYTLAPEVSTALPGLAFDASVPELRGTPSSVTAAQGVRLTYTATDENGNTDRRVFTVTFRSPEVLISETTLTITEGASAAYTIVLAAPSTSAVLVRPVSGDPAAVVTPAVLTFARAAWDVAQTVRVDTVSDTLIADGVVTITHANLTGYRGAPTPDAVVVTITNTDADTTPTFSATETVDDQIYTAGTLIETLTLPEATGVATNGTLVYTLTPDVTTAIPGLDFRTSFRPAPGVRLPTRELFGTPLAATASPVTLTLTATDADGGSASREFTVTVTDARVIISPLELDVYEEGNVEFYTVVLDTYPGNGERMRIDIAAGVGIDVAPPVERNRIDFSENNWNIPQTVRVNVPREDGNEVDEEGISITHTVTGATRSNPYFRFNDQNVGTVIVNVRDDDQAVEFYRSGETTELTEFAVNEGGSGVIQMFPPFLGTPPLTFNSAEIFPNDGGVTFTLDRGLPSTLNTFGANDFLEVTFTAHNDIDTVNNIYRYVQHYTYQGTARSYSFPITATDTGSNAPPATPPAVTIDPLTLTIAEGAMDTYTVTLATDPGGEVVVTPASDNTADVPTPAALTFAAGEWNTPQMVTVTTNADVLEDFADESAQITHTVTGYTGVTTAAAVAVTVTDPHTNTVPSFAATQADPTYTVGDTVDLTLPEATGDGDITHTLTPTADIPAGLNFNANTRVLSGTANAAATATLTYTAADSDAETGAADEASQTFTITVNPAVAAAVVFAPSALTVDEGATGGYTVELSVAPDSGNVVVTPSATGLTLAPATLTFTATSWNTAQSVIITAASDDDTTNETIAISHAVAGAGNYATLTAGGDVTVTVTDTTIPAVTISDDTLSVNEGGSDTYTVRLATIPTANVVITPTATSTATVSGPLTFTAGNWNDAQTVTVTGVADDDAVANTDAVISHAATGAAEYVAVSAIDDVTVTVTETDSVGFTVTPQTLSLNEGFSDSYTVVLTSAPSVGEVTVTPDSPDSDAVSIYSGTDELTFTSANWNVAQVVSVIAEPDDDSTNESVVISNAVTVSNSSSDYDGTNAADVTVTVTDPDAGTPPAVTISTDTLTIAEGGRDTYTVRLATSPSANVVITPSSGNASATVSGPLTFTSGDWNDAQTVTVTAAADADAAPNADAVISHAASGAAEYVALATIDAVTVTIPESQSAAVTIGTTTLSLGEDDSDGDDTEGTYTVALTAPPSAGVVVVTPASDDTGIATVEPAAGLTFDSSNWNVTQLATVTAAIDPDRDDDIANISHTVTGAAEYAGITVAGVRVEVGDTSVPGVALTSDTLTLAEGVSGVYGVLLTTIPDGGNVVITLRLLAGAATFAPATLTFTPATWNVSQSITVTPTADDDAVANTAIGIRHQGSGADYRQASATLRVVVTETNSVGFTVTPPTIALTEGNSASYTVVLTAAPSTGEVTVTPSSADSAAVSVFSGTAELTFTSANWNVAQPVSVIAEPDTDSTNESVVISNAVTVSNSSSDYDGETAAEVTVTVTDSNAPPATPPAVTIDPLTLTIAEGAMDTYTVTLATDPGGEVVVTPASDNTADVPTPAALTFAAAEWNTPQMVTVTTNADVLEDFADESAQITHTVTGYTGVTTAPAVAVTVTDPHTNAVPSFATTQADPTYTVGDTVDLTLPEATGDGDITYTLTPTADIPAGLTFDAGERTLSGTANAAATATLTYTAADSDAETGAADEASQTFTITVDPAGNRPPVAVDDAAAVDTDSTIDIADGAAGDLLLNDSDPDGDTLTIIGVDSSPGLLRNRFVGVGLRASGGGTITIHADGSWSYDPGTAFNSLTLGQTGTATAVYRVSDGNGNTDDGELRITVTRVAGPDISPAFAGGEVVDDQTYTQNNAIADLTLPEVESDGNGATTYALDPSAVPGLVFTANTRVLSGTPDTLTTTAITLTYTATDQDGDSDSLTFAVTVQVDTAPAFASGAVADDQTYTAFTQITPVVLPAVDPSNAGNGAPVYTLTPDIGNAIAGLVFTPGTRTLSGTPTVATTTAVTLTYTLADSDTITGAADEASLTFAITVNPAGNRPPVAVDDAASVTIGSTVAGNVLLNDSDPDGDTLTIIGADSIKSRLPLLGFVGRPLRTTRGGLITIEADGSWSFDPGSAYDHLQAGETLTTDAVYRVSDGNGNTADASVRITVSVSPLVFDSTALTVTEGTDTGAYTIQLSLAPDSGDVVVTPSAPSGSGLSLAPAALTFTATSWNTAQSVRITAAPDFDGNDETVTVSHTVAGAGNYAALTAGGDVTVTVTDDDPRAVTITPLDLTVDEGSDNTYTVELATEPDAGAQVMVTPTVEGDLASHGVSIAPNTVLVFDDTNWNTAQEVVVSAAEDDLDFADSTATISHAVAGYTGVTGAANVVVTVDDNDTDTAPAFASGASVPAQSYTENTQIPDLLLPAVAPAPATQGNGDITYALTPIPSGLNFDATTRILSGTPSAVTAATTTTLTYTAADEDGNAAATDTASLLFTITVNPAPVVPGAVTIAPTNFSLDEDARNGGATDDIYTVVLTAQPSGGSVVVTPVSADTAIATVSPAAGLTFDSSNWNVAQMATVFAVVDPDRDNEIATIRHTVTATAAALEYQSVTAGDVTVTITDTSEPGIALSPAPLTVTEGTTGAYGVQLDTIPSGGDVTIALTLAGGDATFQPASLTFSDATWNVAQSVMVTPATDADAAANTDVTIRHAASGADYATAAAALRVVVPEAQTAGVAISIDTLALIEHSSRTYTVALTSAPVGGDVRVTPSSDTASVTATPAAGLVFTAANWNQAQNLTVLAVRDFNAIHETATITHAVAGADYDSVTAANVVVRVSDINTQGVAISETALIVREGEVGTYTVRLSVQASGLVTITPNIDTTIATIQPAMLIFRSSFGANWNIPQTFTVTGVQDADAADENTDITHTSTGADYGSVTVDDVALTITDDETISVAVSNSAVTVTEGAAGAYTVTLTSEPVNGDVTVTPSIPSGTDLTLSPATGGLTFNAGNWNVAQMVALSTAEDDDAVDDAIVITHTATGADYDAAPAVTVAVTIDDNDNVGVTVTPDTLPVNEGEFATYTVELTSAPSIGEVTVTPSSADTGAVSVTAALVFDAANWDTPQVVSVRGVADDDATNESVEITNTVTVSDGASEYAAATADEVTVTVTDTSIPAVTIAPTDLTVDEGGNRAYTVQLATEPDAGAQVMVTPSVGGDVAVHGVSITPNTALLFDAATWNTAQSVVVSAADDDLDFADSTATISHAVAGYTGVTGAADVVVTVDDDDTDSAPAFASGASVPAQSYTENTQIPALLLPAVAPAPATQGNGDITYTLTPIPSGLNFDATTRILSGTPDTVTTTAITLTYTAADEDGNNADTDTASLLFTVTVNEAVGIVISPSPLQVYEEESSIYSVALDTNPGAGRTVLIQPAAGGTLLTLAPSGALTFTGADWNIPQNVVVSAAGDSDGLTNNTETITHTVTASGANLYTSLNGQNAATLTVTIIDNDHGVSIRDAGFRQLSALTLDEGAAATLTITNRLFAPLVTILSAEFVPNNGALSAAYSRPLPLTFVNNIGSQDRLTITANRDGNVVDNAYRYVIRYRQSGAEYDYSFPITVTDRLAPATPAVTIAPDTLTVNEGESDVYTVRLATIPTANVVITPTATSTATLSPTGALTFTATDWNDAQTITVTGVADADAVANADATISHAATSTDADYDAIAGIDDVTVTVTETDSAGFTVTPTTIALNEGNSASYTVVLTSAPSTGEVTVTPNSPDSAAVSIHNAPTALTFTSADWNVAQVVSVIAEPDTDANDEAVVVSNAVTVSDSSSDYDGETAAEVTVTVTDPDTAPVLVGALVFDIDPLALSVAEGGSGGYTIALSVAPSGDVTVTPSVLGAAADHGVTLTSAAELVFDGSNWDTPQGVSVAAAADAVEDFTDELASIRHAVTGGGLYASVADTFVTVTVDDDDTDTAPRFGTSRFDQIRDFTGVVGVSTTFPLQLTFALAGTGNGALTYTLTPDLATAAPGLTIIPPATPGGPPRIAGTPLLAVDVVMTYTVHDADSNRDASDSDSQTFRIRTTYATPPAITAAPANLRVGEGFSAVYTLSLNNPVPDDVVITPSAPAGSNLAASAVTFTRADWNTARTVTVTAAVDNNAINDTVTVTHTVTGVPYDTVSAPQVVVTITDAQLLGDAPTFGGASVAAQTYDRGFALVPPVTLPEATGGFGALSYALTPSGDIPNGLNFDTITRVLSGTPDTLAAAVTLTLTVTDQDADTSPADSDSLRFAVAVAETTASACLRTPQVRDAILAAAQTANPSVTLADCRFVTATHLAGITRLDVAGVGSLQSGDFAGLSGMTTLSVIDSSLTSLPAGLLDGLSALTTFILARTNVAVLPSGLFSDTPNLTDLRLSQNRLAALPAGLFEGLDFSRSGSQVRLNLNPGSAFTLGLRVERQTSGLFRVRVVEGAPGPVTVTWTQGSNTGSVTILGGGVLSDEFGAVGALPVLSNPAYASGTVSVNYIGIVPGILPPLVPAALVFDSTALSVDEGNTVAYTIELSVAPDSGNVVVTPSAATGLTLAPATLTFTATSWNTAQSVVITAARDADTDNETVTVSHAVAGAGNYAALTAGGDVTVTVTDTTIPAVTISTATLSVNEGESDAYTVVLATSPTDNVVITPTSTATATVSGPLTFTAGNWNVAQSVIVTGVADADAAANADAVISHAATSTDTDYDTLTGIADVTVTITEAQTRGVTVAPSTLSGDEGSEIGAYTVVLTSAPAGGDVTVTPSGFAATDVTLSPSGALTFAAGNWNAEQTITVTAGDDVDFADDTVTLTHAVTGADYAGTNAGNVVVTVNDTTVADTAPAFASGASVPAQSYTENAQITALTLPEVDPMTPGNGDITYTLTPIPSGLNFDAINRVLSGTPDAVTAATTTTLTYTAADADNDTDSLLFTVTVSPAPVTAAALVFDRRALTVDEDGAAVAYTIALSVAPDGGNVTVTPDATTGLTFAPAALTFAAGNFDTAQNIAVTAAHDFDGADDTVAVSHAVVGAGNYATLTAGGDVTVTVEDNDPRGVTVTLLGGVSSLSLSEGSNTATYSVVLDTEPVGGDVTVAPSVAPADHDLTLNPATLDFTATDWNVAQTVQIMIGEDDDGILDRFTITHAASGADYDGVTAATTLSGSTNDNDPRGVTISETTLTVAETAIGTYTVRLDTQPPGDVLITPNNSDTSVATVSPTGALTFTNATWNIEQTVTVTGVAAGTTNITHAVGGHADYTTRSPVVTAGSIAVTVITNTAPAFASGASVPDQSYTENAAITTLQLPAVDAMTPGNGAPVYTLTPTADIPGGLNFDPTARTLSGTPSAVVAATTVTLTYTVADTDGVSGAADEDSLTFAVTVNPAAPVVAAGVVISPLALDVYERGASGRYTVVLDTSPGQTGMVQIAVARTNTDLDLAIPGGTDTLTFVAGDYNIPQTVVVSVDNEDGNSVDEVATITHTLTTASGSGNPYASLLTQDVGTVQVTIRDISHPLLFYDADFGLPTALSVAEGDSTGGVLLVGGDQADDTPLTLNRIEIVPDDGGLSFTTDQSLPHVLPDIDLETVLEVTFTANNDIDTVDNVYRYVQHYTDVNGVAGSISFPITATDTGSNAPAPALVFDPTELTVDERSTGAYTVELSVAPDSGSVTVTPSAGSGLTLAPATLIFTAADWNTAQDIAVTAAPDDDTVNETLTISHAVSGAGNYATLTAGGDVTVTVTDTSIPAVTIAPTDLTVDEGVDGAYTVQLATEPATGAQVMVTPTVEGDLASHGVTIAPSAALVFDSTNWNTAQSVVVSAAQDDLDFTDATATISHAVAGYTGVTGAADVVVTVDDNDTDTAPAFASGASVPAQSYTENTQIPALVLPEVAPAPATQGNGDITYTLTPIPSGLNFDAINRVLSGTPDAVTAATTTTLTYTAADEDGNTAASDTDSLLFTVTINPAPPAVVTLRLEPDALTIDEAAAAVAGSVYTVRLSSQPASDVTVTPSIAATDHDLTLTFDGAALLGAALTFVTAEWNDAQTVTVTAAADPDMLADTVTITHAATGTSASIAAAEVVVTVDDTSTPGITLDPDALTVAENARGHLHHPAKHHSARRCDDYADEHRRRPRRCRAPHADLRAGQLERGAVGDRLRH